MYRLEKSQRFCTGWTVVSWSPCFMLTHHICFTVCSAKKRLKPNPSFSALTLGWVIWSVKTVPDMTRNVFGGTLNLTQLQLLPKSCHQLVSLWPARWHGVCVPLALCSTFIHVSLVNCQVMSFLSVFWVAWSSVVIAVKTLPSSKSVLPQTSYFHCVLFVFIRSHCSCIE